MEIRSLVAILITLTNAIGEAASAAAEELEKLMSADGGDEVVPDKPARKSRKKVDDEDDEPPARNRPSRAKAKAKDEDEDEEEEEEEEENDEPSEDDVIDAVRAAQKVLPRDDIAKLVKKFGKAERSRDVKPENRRHLIVNLERAIKNAEED